MRLTEQRYRHWKGLRATPGVVVMMSERIADCVDTMIAAEKARPGTPYPVLVACAAYANMLDSRYYLVNE